MYINPAFDAYFKSVKKLQNPCEKVNFEKEMENGGFYFHTMCKLIGPSMFLL